MLVRDGKGSVRVKFFNQTYLRQVYKVGVRLIIYGQVKKDPYARGSLVLMNPECEIFEEERSGISVHSGRVVPIYRRLGELRTRTLRQIMDAVLSHLPSDIPDAIPAQLCRKLRLLPKSKAVAQLHFPKLRSVIPARAAKGIGPSQCGAFSGAQAAHF